MILIDPSYKKNVNATPVAVAPSNSSAVGVINIAVYIYTYICLSRYRYTLVHAAYVIYDLITGFQGCNLFVCYTGYSK